MLTLSSILGFFTSTAAGNATLAAAALWFIGLFAKSSAYKRSRDTWGRICEKAGLGLSILGNTRLGKLWAPLESFLCDFLLFGAEQLAVGLRNDNPERIEDQLDRLRGVDSVTRHAALLRKLDVLQTIPEPMRNAQDAAMFHRLNEQGEGSIQGKLGDP